MKAHYGVVDGDGLVVNVVVWDGVSDYEPGEGLTLVPLPYTEDEDGTRHYTGGIGWDYVDGEFVDNRPVEEEPE
ncbi:MAG TPA: hypothetical protein VIG24_09040 [Acidimicrobiia bacterium]